MEKLYSRSAYGYVTIYCKKYNRIYLSKQVFCNLKEANNSEINTVDVYIDEKHIKIIPNPHGEFALSFNGSSPNGRNVSLKRSVIEKYGIEEGHYPCRITNDGELLIKLERMDDDA